MVGDGFWNWKFFVMMILFKGSLSYLGLLFWLYGRVMVDIWYNGLFMMDLVDVCLVIGFVYF